VEGDEVILTGTATSREEKRRAEDLVESISGVRNVENRIRVEPSTSSYTRE
jgi:osmotically-inducible protein OsmY